MPQPTDGQITMVLQAIHAGDGGAPTRLMELVYESLRDLAKARLANQPGSHTLQPTALVHEAYLRLMSKDSADFENRRHFFFAAARAMRDILVEQARSKSGPRRGGDRQREVLDESSGTTEPPPDEVLTLHESLELLERDDPQRAQVVLLRYFGGMTMIEVADVLGIAEVTAHRHWRFARAWFKSRLA
jgi:RNA polymerase sigma factor (TIGR02999 family)